MRVSREHRCNRWCSAGDAAATAYQATARGPAKIGWVGVRGGEEREGKREGGEEERIGWADVVSIIIILCILLLVSSSYYCQYHHHIIVSIIVNIIVNIIVSIIIILLLVSSSYYCYCQYHHHIMMIIVSIITSIHIVRVIIIIIAQLLLSLSLSFDCPSLLKPRIPLAR